MTEKLQSATVIRGVLDIPIDDDDNNSKREGRAAFMSRSRRYYPGERVELPADEVQRLVRLGVLREL